MSRVLISQIPTLVTKAFVLEAISDKPGCTTRYSDLPGKPLQDFIIAGINTANTLGDMAKVISSDPNTPIFPYNVAALEVSNQHKSGKYINFGLLEIMVPTIAARIACDDASRIVSEIIGVIKRTKNEDVQALLQTRKIAWSTSKTPHKQGFRPEKYQNMQCVWDFYDALFHDFPSTSSNHQWALQYKQDLPILHAFFAAYMNEGSVVLPTKEVFLQLHRLYPDVAVGILADMCATAMFLWLSYNDSPV